MNPWIRKTLAPTALALGLCAGLPAQAQSEASVMLSVLPMGSVLAAADGVPAASGAALALPVALSVGGAVLSVKAVEASATGTVYVLERASDGAKVSIRVAAQAGKAVAHSVGTAVTCSVTSTGVVLSAAGEVLAFVPNAVGRALLYNEKL